MPQVKASRIFATLHPRRPHRRTATPRAILRVIMRPAFWKIPRTDNAHVCDTFSRISRRLEPINIETGRTPGARFARVLPGRAEHARGIENEEAHLAVRCGLQAMPFAITKPDQIAFAHRRALIVRPRGPTAAQEINERLRALM